MVQLNMNNVQPLRLMRLYANRLRQFAGVRRLAQLGALMVLGAGLEPSSALVLSWRP